MLALSSTLGHVSDVVVNKVLHSIGSKTLPYQDFVVCIACAIVKSYWLSFVSQHVIMSKPFKLIYLDIWGPGPSLGNSSKLTFFLLFNDTI